MSSPLVSNLVPFPPQSNFAVCIFDGVEGRPAGYVNLMFRTIEQASYYANRLEGEAKAFYQTDDLYKATFGLRVEVVRLN